MVLATFKNYEHFCKTMLDAYIVVNTTGRIVKNNQLFSVLVGKKSKQILRANSCDELLTLTITGQPLSIKTLLTISAPTRLDEVQGQTSDKNSLSLILGIYPLTT